MSRAPISLLYFTNSVVRGGAEEHLLTLMRGLDRRLFRVDLVATPEVAGLIRPDLPADVELIPLGLRKPSDFKAAVRLSRIIRQRRVHILHSHLFYSSVFASPIGWLCRVPVIMETPHVREQWRSGWIKSRFLVDRAVGRCIDRYIAVSEANCRYLVESKGLPRHKITVVHNGVDLRRFDPAHEVPAGLKASLGFAAADPTLVCVGRLEPQKGHSVLIAAMPRVRSQFRKARLILVGEGSLGSAVAAQARALGLEDAVYFAGYQANVADWLALANVTVLPSLYEGLPIAAIESLAAGRPMVATAVDGTPEVIVDGKTGLTVPPGDPAKLAEAICKLLGDKELAGDLALAGRRWVVDRFSQELQVSRTQEVYLHALEEESCAICQAVIGGSPGSSR